MTSLYSTSPNYGSKDPGNNSGRSGSSGTRYIRDARDRGDQSAEFASFRRIERERIGERGVREAWAVSPEPPDHSDDDAHLTEMNKNGI